MEGRALLVEHRTDYLKRSGVIRPAQVLSAGCDRRVEPRRMKMLNSGYANKAYHTTVVRGLHGRRLLQEQ